MSRPDQSASKIFVYSCFKVGIMPGSGNKKSAGIIRRLLFKSNLCEVKKPTQMVLFKSTTWLEVEWNRNTWERFQRKAHQDTPLIIATAIVTTDCTKACCPTRKIAVNLILLVFQSAVFSLEAVIRAESPLIAQASVGPEGIKVGILEEWMIFQQILTHIKVEVIGRHERNVGIDFCKSHFFAEHRDLSNRACCQPRKRAPPNFVEKVGASM